jgi:hypothetical protein
MQRPKMPVSDHVLASTEDMAQVIRGAEQQGHLLMWTIYDKPLDRPDSFVMRPFAIIPGETEPRPLACCLVANRVEYLRERCEEFGLGRLPRSPQDEPQIVEIWF